MSSGARHCREISSEGQYAGRILKEDKPSETLCEAADQFDLVINLKTPRRSASPCRRPLLAQADDAIE